MKKILNTNENKAITLIALVITVVILVILGGIAVNLAMGENGIIGRAKQAAMMQKKAQYYEEVNTEIISEQMDRLMQAKEEAFIVSINERLTGKKQASNETVSSYTKKEWIESTTMCDEEKDVHANPFDNNRLYIYTKEGYELVLIVNNQALTASIEEESFQKTADKVNVTYDSNGGSGSMDKDSILPGFKITLKESEFSRDRYTFTGWCLNSDSTGDKYQPGSNLRITEDTTLYAVWSMHTAVITFNANTGEGEMTPRNVDVNETYQLTKNTFTKEGYTFSKWTTNADGTGDEYTDEGDISTDTDVTLYAQWVPQAYTITYALSGGSISGEKTTYTIEDAAFQIPTPTKNGYTFTGWTGTDLTSTTTNVTVPAGSTGARAYTATWSVITYNITYDLDGGTGVENRTYTVEDTFTLPTPTKSKFNFTGWTGSNGPTAQTSVTISAGTTGDKSYTANWESIPAYTVTFNANGGSVSEASRQVTSGEAYGALPTPTRSGFNFLGWTTNLSYYKTNITAETVMGSANVTVYAKWAVSSGTKTYLFNAGNQCTSLTGGWSRTGKTVYSGSSTTYGVDSNNKLYVHRTMQRWPSSSWPADCYYLGTSNQINLTNYKTITANVTDRDTGYYFVFVNPSMPTAAWPSCSSMVYMDNTFGGGEVTVDVSQLTGSYYVGIGVGQSSGGGTTTKIYCSYIYMQ